MRALQDGDALNGGTPQVWDLFVPVLRPRGREFLQVGNLPRCPRCGELEYMPNVDGDDGAAKLLRYTPYLYTQWKLKQRPQFSTEITCPPDCALMPHNLEQDYIALMRNLEVAQIPRLHRTYAL